MRGANASIRFLRIYDVDSKLVRLRAASNGCERMSASDLAVSKTLAIQKRVESQLLNEAAETQNT